MLLDSASPSVRVKIGVKIGVKIRAKIGVNIGVMVPSRQKGGVRFGDATPTSPCHTRP